MLSRPDRRRPSLQLSARLALTIMTLLISATASAQGSGGIGGVVKDTSGAVVPGVTVEATSPALIEKIRTVVTDGQGVYLLVGLRPGSYVVTFTLSGFTTIQRVGIEVTANFTASVNADLTVGSVAETLTVTGVSPVVDTQNVVQQRVITSQVLESLPTAKSLQSMGALVPGVSMSATQHEVGGAVGDKPVGMAIHGGRVWDQHMFFDGMRTNNIGIGGSGGGANQSIFFNPLTVQEITMELGNLTPSSDTGGININVIPRDGGNTFAGSFFVSGSNGKLQGDNLTDDLKARGLTAVGEIKKIWDANGAFGGPIARDKVWFYTAYRNWGNENYVANQYFNKTPLAWTYTPDFSRQATDPNNLFSLNARATWQATRQQKVTFTTERQDQCYCYSGIGSNVSPEATQRVESSPNIYVQGRWTDVVTSRLLLEAGAARNTANWQGAPQAEVGPDVISVTELTTNFTYRAPTQFNGRQHDDAIHFDSRYYMFAASYVTGSHAFKVGSTLLQGRPYSDAKVNGDMTYQFFNGVPRTVVLRTTPLRSQQRLKADVGLYVQDQWKVERLTVNAGLRYAYLNAYIPEQPQDAGTFVPARVYPKVPGVATYHDVTPRLGAAYDLRGNGKTALKATWNKYLMQQGANAATSFNPINTVVNTASRQWITDDGNYVPDCDLLSSPANGECGPLSNSSFGKPGLVTTRIDQNTLHGSGKRNYNWETTVGIQQELWAGVSANATYFYRSYGNFRINDNLAVAPSDYDPYCVDVPLDTRLPGGGGNQLCGLYDINPTKFGPVDNLVTFTKQYGEVTDRFYGIDFGVNARLPRQTFVQGGVSFGREIMNMCDIVGKVDAAGATLPLDGTGLMDLLPSVSGMPSPSGTFCRYAQPFLVDFRLSGSYQVPWGGVLLSATIQSKPGPEIAATAVLTNAPSLGRPFAAGSATVQYVEPGTLYGDRLNQVDFRFARPFTWKQIQIKPMVDLYNLFNASPVLTLNNRYGPAWQTPQRILPARFVKLGAQVDF